MKSVGLFHGSIKKQKGQEGIPMGHVDHPSAPGSLWLPWLTPAACPGISLALLSGKTCFRFELNLFAAH